MTKISALALSTCLLLAACSKSDSSPQNTFVVNGVHDVDMGTRLTALLPIALNTETGKQEPVTISVSGLPSGITASAAPASGTPDFASIVTFTQTARVEGGSYPITITASSASYEKDYKFNLSMPSLNGFMLNGVKFTKSSIKRFSSDLIVETNDDKGGAYLYFDLGKQWPTADGTYRTTVGLNKNSKFLASIRGTLINSNDGPLMDVVYTVSGGKIWMKSDPPLAGTPGSDFSFDFTE